MSHMEQDMDRISNLPKNVVDIIFMHLPIKDVVRTSILSRTWRYEWSTVSEIVFNEDVVPLLEDMDAQTVHDGKLVEIVDQVLLLHRGSICKFVFSNYLKRCEVIDRWVIFVSRCGIKEFTLNKFEGEFYKVPSHLFSCQEITYLELFRCTIVLPASFKGFARLRTLDLQNVNFSNNGVETLISACPLLKKLVLSIIDGCDHLNISAPKLVELELFDFKGVYFENTPLLAILSLDLSISGDEVVSEGTECRLVQVLSSLPRIEKLELSDKTFSILARGDVPFKLPTSCVLKYISIELNFEDIQQLLAALCIFKSSPILQKLRIMGLASSSTADISIEGFWEAQDRFDCLFNRLQILEVTNFSGAKSELKFVELVLANAPALMNVKIDLKQKVDCALTIATEMIRFPRVSPKAEIEFLAHQLPRLEF